MVVARHIFMETLVVRIDGLGWSSRYSQLRYELTRLRFVIANLLALAAVCPFVGSLSDLIGRRYVALLVGFTRQISANCSH
jgi:MFS family permease